MPMTGYWRDGCCESGPEDMSMHTVCAVMTAEFLAFSVTMGNDLTSPRPEYGFPGLRPGDRWCLSVMRWAEALENDVAPPVVLNATHEACLEFVAAQALLEHALPV